MVWCGWGSRAITSLSYSWGEDMAEEFHCTYTIYSTQYRPGGCGVHGMYTVQYTGHCVYSTASQSQLLYIMYVCKKTKSGAIHDML